MWHLTQPQLSNCRSSVVGSWTGFSSFTDTQSRTGLHLKSGFNSLQKKKHLWCNAIKKQWLSELETEWREGAALARTKQWIREIKRFLIVSLWLLSINPNTLTPPHNPEGSCHAAGFSKQQWETKSYIIPSLHPAHCVFYTFMCHCFKAVSFDNNTVFLGQCVSHDCGFILFMAVC